MSKNLYGILTTTDIHDKIIAQDKNPANTSVREIVSENLVTANPEWTLKHCSMEMKKNNIHHMPIFDIHSSLVGLVSSTD
jgi:CBS domain-containing protein